MPDDETPAWEAAGYAEGHRDDDDAIRQDRAAERAISDGWAMLPHAERSERAARRAAARQDFFRRQAARRWGAAYRGRR